MMANYTKDYVDKRLEWAFLDVYVEDETLADCVQNTWYSPSTGQVGPAGTYNMSYDGSAELENLIEEGARVKVTTVASISTTGTTVTLEITNGKNGSPCLVGAMPASTTILGGGQDLPISTVCVFSDCGNGDYFDFFVRQTSETGTPDITINKLRFIVEVIGIGD